MISGKPGQSAKAQRLSNTSNITKACFLNITHTKIQDVCTHHDFSQPHNLFPTSYPLHRTEVLIKQEWMLEVASLLPNL